jgi:ABC-type branched-subunit amino acid transport system ATPase component
VSSTWLELRDVSKSFGGIHAVRDLSMAVGRAEILGLIGPNGAGKSTVLGLVSGQQRPSAGRISLGGRRIDRLPQWRRVRAGVAHIPQHAANLDRATVLENVALGLGARGMGAGRAPCLAVLDELGLGERADQPAGALSHWEKRLLGLARALATGPTVALLDEPLAGLSTTETEQYMAVIRRLRIERNMTFVVTEHNVDAVLRLCDRIVALHFGEQIGCDAPAEIVKNERVIEVYLGGPSWRC